MKESLLCCHLYSLRKGQENISFAGTHKLLSTTVHKFSVNRVDQPHELTDNLEKEQKHIRIKAQFINRIPVRKKGRKETEDKYKIHGEKQS